MDRAQNLEKDRLARLRNMKTILGEPDLLTIVKATTINSFLSQKKVYEKQEKFVFGLNFPTTAHFSSFMNDRIHASRKGSKAECLYKIKLYIFDIFRKVDFQIQINIPGSLEMRAYNLNGQPVQQNSIDYESVYISSVLRSLYPHYYHVNTQIYGQIESYVVLSAFIKKFVPFAIKNQLQIPEDLVEVYNLGIQLLSYYLKKNSFWNLSDILQTELNKFYPNKAFILGLELQELKGDYKSIVCACSQKLLGHNCDPELISKMLEFQVRSLCKLGKKQEAKFLGENIIRQGLDRLETWEELLRLYFQDGDDRYYFKMLNTAINFLGEDSSLKQKLEKLVYPPKIDIPHCIEQKAAKGKQIGLYPEFMLKFDYAFMEKDTKLRGLHQMLEKTQKQKPTSQILTRLNTSYEKQSHFQKFVSMFEKQRGWNKLIQQRNECFWLENDYINYENSIKKKTSDMSYRFINESLNQIDNASDTEKSKGQEKSIKRYESESDEDSQNLDQSFDGEFSESQSAEEGELNTVAPCSKRIATKRVSREQILVKKVEFVKVICSYSLEKIFLLAYNNLKLHSDIEKWFLKLDFNNLQAFTKQKKQLLGYLFLKKGFFHKNMLRYRKSEQSFKIARKCTNDQTISLIACYSLAKLYLEHNNIKGVQFYTVEIVRILYTLGIEQFKVVPTWAKEIIPYIIKHYGKAITKRLQGPLKQVVELWLRIDYKPQS